MTRRIVFGVDAGGTKTKVLLGEVVEGQLKTIGDAVGPPGNPRSVGFEKTFSSIKSTLIRAYQSSGIDFAIADSACLSVAGAGRADERERMLNWCIKEELAKTSVVVGDAECLLASAPGDESGIAVIAGTGSMAWGRSATNKSARAGGCGYLFDDEGSGYWIAAKALNHVCMASDARKSSTSLVAAILEHLQLSTAQELIGWCYDSLDPRSQIASIAPVVFQEYPHDRVAQNIIQGGAKSLASLVVAVASELALPPSGFTLVCAGSVLIKQTIYRSLFEAAFALQNTTPREIHYVVDPTVGALKIAARNA